MFKFTLKHERAELHITAYWNEYKDSSVGIMNDYDLIIEKIEHNNSPEATAAAARLLELETAIWENELLFEWDDFLVSQMEPEKEPDFSDLYNFNDLYESTFDDGNHINDL